MVQDSQFFDTIPSGRADSVIRNTKRPIQLRQSLVETPAAA
jgi:hypothetical protein